MCAGGGGGGGTTVAVPEVSVSLDPPELPTLDDVTDVVDHNLGQVHDVLDHNLGQVKEGVIDPIADVALTTLTEGPEAAYQGSDIDTTLETFQGMGELMIDIIDTAISGEDKGKVKDIKQAGSDYQEAWEEVGEDYQEGLDNLQNVVTDTVGTTNQVLTDIGTNVSEQFREAMGLTDEPEGGAVTEETRGGDVERDDLMLTLGKKKSDLKAAKKKGKKGLRIDYGVSLPGSGKSGIAA